VLLFDAYSRRNKILSWLCTGWLPAVPLWFLAGPWVALGWAFLSPYLIVAGMVAVSQVRVRARRRRQAG
jgi:hypothetical protein